MTIDVPDLRERPHPTRRDRRWLELVDRKVDTGDALASTDGNDIGVPVVARLTIDRMQLHVGGGATVSMDAVGNVFTAESQRGRGLARTLMLDAVERMRRSDAAISMLYGIDDFYDRLGWRPAGDECWLRVEVAKRPAASALPDGWVMRDATSGDLPAMRRLYDEVAREVVGASARDDGAGAWRAVSTRRPGATAHVLIDDAETLVAYTLPPEPFPVARAEAERCPRALVVAELQARDDVAATAALGALVVDARAAGRMAVHVGTSPRTTVARAARSFPHEFARQVRPRGGSMVLLLDAARWAGGLVGRAPVTATWTTQSVAAWMRAREQYLFLPDRY